MSCQDGWNDSCECSSSSALNICRWQVQYSVPLVVIITFFYVIILLLAFVWNSLVIVIFIKDRNLLQALSSVFLIALAVVDLLEAVLFT